MDIQMRNLRQVQDLRREFQSIRLVVISSAARLGWEFMKQMDKQHKKYYEFYTGEKWGKPENYDLCINSANYGLKDTIELIRRMLDQKVH